MTFSRTVLIYKMYFIELIVNAILNRKKNKQKSDTDFDPMQENFEEDYESCEHIFMPIDSNGDILACRNCGLVVNRKDLKNKNFFMRKKTEE